MNCIFMLIDEEHGGELGKQTEQEGTIMVVDLFPGPSTSTYLIKL